MTGVGNTAAGWYSLFTNTSGSYKTGVGAGTLLFNIGNSKGAGSQNTAIGTAALLFNTAGSGNAAVGVTALLNNTEGANNTAIGEQALYTNTIGFSNTAIGAFALFGNSADTIVTPQLELKPSLAIPAAARTRRTRVRAT